MQRDTKIKIGKIILGTVATAGLISMAVLAPNAVQCIEMFYPNKKRKYNREWYVKTAIGRLKQQGLIKFEKKSGKTFVRLTKKGKEKLLKYQLQEIKIKKPKKWDGKWRVVIFDIKEQRRYIRDGLREELINLGFLRLQNSVWVCPYECEEIVIMLKSHFKIGKDVLYMIVERIENDKWLKREFDLIE
jgi:CRISPR-associated endonuclease Cas2